KLAAARIVAKDRPVLRDGRRAREQHRGDDNTHDGPPAPVRRDHFTPGAGSAMARRALSRRANSAARISASAVAASMRVAKALILGLTPSRIAENTTMGRVVACGPVTKLAMTKSSNDSTKASNHPDATAGMRRGSTMRQKTVAGF